MHELTDITNVKKQVKDKSMHKKKLSDKENVLRYLKEAMKETKNHTLAYDISKCIELIEGKENQMVVDMKDAMEELILENMKIEEERKDLINENEELKRELRDLSVEKENYHN